MIDLETHRGTTGSAVELGPMPVLGDGPPCGGGGWACPQADTALAATCPNAGELGRADGFDRLVATAPLEPRLIGLFSRAGRLLGQALGGAVDLFDADAVVISSRPSLVPLYAPTSPSDRHAWHA